jgi:hypothetical protein
MIKNKPLSFFDKIAAYVLSIVCISAGSIGLFLSIYNYQSILVPLASMAFIIIGILYGIAAFKGKPVPGGKKLK